MYMNSILGLFSSMLKPISTYIEKSCDHVKKSTMEANHLKILIS